MKYCTQCGTQLTDHSTVCPSCGYTVSAMTAVQAPARRSALSIVAMVFMIVSTALCAFLPTALINLAWRLPMTITYCVRVKNNQSVGIGFKVCSLIFVDPVAGILMLCDHSHDDQGI